MLLSEFNYSNISETQKSKIFLPHCTADLHNMRQAAKQIQASGHLSSPAGLNAQPVRGTFGLCSVKCLRTRYYLFIITVNCEISLEIRFIDFLWFLSAAPFTPAQHRFSTVVPSSFLKSEMKRGAKEERRNWNHFFLPPPLHVDA